jgi:phosphoribosylformimino-5-aminoimidazole carboxamide ribotide isomerase
MSFTVYPAIDVRAGRVVRLAQGDYARETCYADDPVALARRYAKDGATWLHLVDLDAARDGSYTLHAMLARIVRDTGLAIQTGGGVRSAADVQSLFDAGAARVVVGSLAVREPERVSGWITQFGAGRLTVALDTRRDDQGLWRLPLHGWTQASDRNFDQLLAYYTDSGLQHLLCTDIARDGMLSGPNPELYRTVLQRSPGLEVQASGGARHVEDVAAMRAAGCAGIVLGKSLLEQRIELGAALEFQDGTGAAPLHRPASAGRGESTC